VKRSRTEKSPWKSKPKLGPNKKKIDDFHPDKRQSLAESDKGSWFNQVSESEAASASFLDISAVSKEMNNIIEAKKAEESNVTRERLPRTNPDYSSLLDSSLSESSASLFLFCGSTFFSFRFVLC